MYIIMSQFSHLKTIGLVLAATIAITITYSYVPLDQSLVRHILALAQGGCMLVIVAMTLRSVLTDF